MSFLFTFLTVVSIVVALAVFTLVALANGGGPVGKVCSRICLWFGLPINPQWWFGTLEKHKPLPRNADEEIAHIVRLADRLPPSEWQELCFFLRGMLSRRCLLTTTDDVFTVTSNNQHYVIIHRLVGEDSLYRYVIEASDKRIDIVGGQEQYYEGIFHNTSTADLTPLTDAEAVELAKKILAAR